MIYLFLACEDKNTEEVEGPNFDTPDWTDETHGKKANPNYHVVFPSNKVNRMDVIFRSGGFIGIFEGMAEDDVIRIISHPTSMFETDGDLVELGMGFPHPRSYGSFPRILSKYVRDKEVLTLEEAIHKMTLLPALWIGQSDRGLIRKGAIADMTVFDFETIQDKATYNDPHHFSTGILHVFVGGVAVLNNNKITGKRPGRFIERSRN